MPQTWLRAAVQVSRDFERGREQVRERGKCVCMCPNLSLRTCVNHQFTCAYDKPAHLTTEITYGNLGSKRRARVFSLTKYNPNFQHFIKSGSWELASCSSQLSHFSLSLPKSSGCLLFIYRVITLKQDSFRLENTVLSRSKRKMWENKLTQEKACLEEDI